MPEKKGTVAKVRVKPDVDKAITKFIEELEKNDGIKIEWPPEIRTETIEAHAVGRITPLILQTFTGRVTFRIPEYLLEIHSSATDKRRKK
jgi:hypothetical protein